MTREPSFTTEAHPQSGRNPPTGNVKAAKKAPPLKKKAQKKAAKASAPKKSVVRAIITGIDVKTGKKVRVIIQGRNPPTGSAD